jgi:hypothetical protein
MKLQDELREKVAALVDRFGNNHSAARLRGEPVRDGYDTPRLVTAAEAVIALLDDYEEVEVRESLWPQDPFGRYHRLVMPDDRYAGGIWTQHVMAAHTILIRKQEPEKVEVTRETLAVLTEHYRDTPAKSNECDRAAAEADRLLKR